MGGLDNSQWGCDNSFRLTALGAGADAPTILSETLMTILTVTLTIDIDDVAEEWDNTSDNVLSIIAHDPANNLAALLEDELATISTSHLNGTPVDLSDLAKDDLGDDEDEEDEEEEDE